MSAADHPYVAAVLRDGAVAYWRLREAGVVFADDSGHGHDARTPPAATGYVLDGAVGPGDSSLNVRGGTGAFTVNRRITVGGEDVYVAAVGPGLHLDLANPFAAAHADGTPITDHVGITTGAAGVADGLGIGTAFAVVTLDHPFAFGRGTPGSIEFWIRPREMASGDFGGIIQQGVDGFGVWTQAVAGGGTQIAWYDNLAGGWPLPVLVAGELYHVVMTVDPTASTPEASLLWYVNGVLQTDVYPTAEYVQGATFDVLAGASYTWDADLAADLLDELAVYPTVLTAAQVANHYALAAVSIVGCVPRVDVILDGAVDWVSLMADVVNEAGITATRGISGTGPTDRVCQPGTLEFTLNNGASNSARTASYYSPAHPDVRPGWMEGCAVRLVATYRDVDYPLWRGRIRTIDPTPGRTPMRATVLAQDAAADLSAAVVATIPPQIGQSETALLEAVVDALAPEARPPVLLDPPLDVYPYAFDNAGGGTVALGLMNDAVMSAVGTLFVDGLGRLRYRNRQNQAAEEPALVIGDDDLMYRGPGFAGASSLRNVFNRMRVTVHPKTTTAGVVLFHSDAAIELVPGTAFVVWDSYSDPNNRDRLIGGFGFVPVVPGTDYRANDAANGSGMNRTAVVLVVVEAFVASAKTTLTNTSGAPVFVTMRQLRGTAIFDNAPVTLEAFLPKNYGDRGATVDLPFQDSIIKAQNLAEFLLAQYADRARAGEELVYNPQRSTTLMAGAVGLDIGSVVTASELAGGVINVPYDVRGITYTFERARTGSFLSVRYRIAPHVSGAPGSAAWTFDHPTKGLLDSGTVFGFA